MDGCTKQHPDVVCWVVVLLIDYFHTIPPMPQNIRSAEKPSIAWIVGLPVTQILCNEDPLANLDLYIPYLWLSGRVFGWMQRTTFG